MRASLFAKKARVMQQLSRLPKSGTNTHFKYAFATDSDVLDAIRSKMAEEQLSLAVSMLEVFRQGDITTAKFEMTLCDGETGETDTVCWFAEAQDKGDKGINKCSTAAVKYYLLKNFLLSTGDLAEDADMHEGVATVKVGQITAIRAKKNKEGVVYYIIRTKEDVPVVANGSLEELLSNSLSSETRNYIIGMLNDTDILDIPDGNVLRVEYTPDDKYNIATRIY